MELAYADAHVHVECFQKDGCPKTLELLELHRKKGATDLSLLSYMPGCAIVSNLNILWWKMKYRAVRLHAFGCFHEDDCYQSIPYETQYQHLMALGCDGIKFIQMKPDRRKPLGKGLNHPSYDAALWQMEKDGTPVMIHSGDPQEFWDRSQVSEEAIRRGWFYGDGTYPSAQQLYEEIFEMLQKHPRLNVTFAHFFFLSGDLQEARRVMDSYPNVKFDLTPGGEMYEGFARDIDAWQAFFMDYKDRILFGTDSCDTKHPVANQRLIDSVREVLTHDKSSYRMPIYAGYDVKGLQLSEAKAKKICRENYIREIGGEVKAVNEDLFYQSARRMLLDLQGLSEYAASAEWLSWLCERS